MGGGTRTRHRARDRPGVASLGSIPGSIAAPGRSSGHGTLAAAPRFRGGAHGYRFGAYVAAMTRQMLESLLARRDGIPQPVRKLHWTGHQGYNQLACLAINGQEWPDDFGVETSIPANCEWPEEDEVMLRFLRVHGQRIDDGAGQDGDDAI